MKTGNEKRKEVLASLNVSLIKIALFDYTQNSKNFSLSVADAKEEIEKIEYLQGFRNFCDSWVPAVKK